MAVVGGFLVVRGVSCEYFGGYCVIFCNYGVFERSKSTQRSRKGEFTTRTLVHRIVSLDDVKQIKNANEYGMISYKIYMIIPLCTH